MPLDLNIEVEGPAPKLQFLSYQAGEGGFKFHLQAENQRIVSTGFFKLGQYPSKYYKDLPCCCGRFDRSQILSQRPGETLECIDVFSTDSEGRVATSEG